MHAAESRGAALASRLDPLAYIDDKRGRSEALYVAVLDGTSISDPEPVRFSCDPENWAHGQATCESSAKDIISDRISVPARAAIVPLLDCLPACMAHDFCNPEDPDAVGDDSSLFAVTLQQWRACVPRMVRCTLACMLPPSSLDPRLASGAFAVAKDEGRDRFIGDRRPLNSRERSIARAHLPYFPRLRRLIFGKSLYEVPRSRVTTQVIRPRIPRSWIDHLDDDTWDVVDFAQIGMTAIVWGDVNAVYTLECAHRRQLLCERTLPTDSGTARSRSQRRLDVKTLTIWSFSVFLQLSDVRLA